MARASSKVSDNSLTELRATKGMLDQRWLTLTAQLGAALGFNSQQVRVDAELQGERVWVGLQGSVCERVVRNRGGAANVAPLCSLPKELVAWLALQEVWDVKTGAKPFVFRQLGLTIHFGFRGDPIKPQVLRLEWPGVRDWTGAGIAFQTPGAGHPHWQIDILQSIAQSGKAEAFVVDLPEVIEDFEVETAMPRLEDLLQSMTIENIHLASAARWWLPSLPDQGSHHMNAPPDSAALSRWLSEGVQYVRQELARCVVRT